MFASFFAALVTQDAPDPYRLPIGTPGQVVVSPNTLVDTRTGRTLTVEDFAKQADGHRFVYLGESHATKPHQDMHAKVIEALVARGRDVVVGFEMFTRPVQGALNPWTLGWWSDEEFQQKADWKTQWGFDYAFYKPVFDATKKHKLPMVALNVPRDWVRVVGREGLGALTAEQKAELPGEFDLTNQGHRDVFGALMGGHPPTGARGENIYAAQVLWDVAMADSALKFFASRPTTRNTVMVVLAGSGHVMYGQGINYRLWKRTGEKGLTMVMIQSKGPATVSKGLADVVYAAEAGG